MSDKNSNSFSLINFYEVLDIKPTATNQEIKNKYKQLQLKYHPDKSKDNYDDNIYKLIQKAYSILSDDKKREEYDFLMNNIKTSQNNDHIKLKNNYNKYTKLTKLKEDEKDDKTKEEDLKLAKIEFDKMNNELNQKHGINSFDNTVLSSEDFNSKTNDLLLKREQEEIEYTQNRIFKPNEKFDLDKFNAAFDLHKSMSENQLEEFKEVSSYNFANNNTSFSDLDNLNYGDLYNDDNSNLDNLNSNLYSATSLFASNKNINNLNMDKLHNIKVDKSKYDHTKDRNSDEYKKEMAKKLEDMQKEREDLLNISFGNFNTNDNSYQFLHQVGFNDNTIDYIETDDDKDVLELLKNN